MRLLLADDQSKVRSALRLLLEQQPGWVVVGEAAEASGLVSQVRSAAPDVVLLDWELPGQRPANLVTTLRALAPQARIIALSGRPEARQPALAAQADAFVSKGDPPEALLAAVNKQGK